MKRLSPFILCLVLLIPMLHGRPAEATRLLNDVESIKSWTAKVQFFSLSTNITRGPAFSPELGFHALYPNLYVGLRGVSGKHGSGLDAVGMYYVPVFRNSKFLPAIGFQYMIRTQDKEMIRGTGAYLNLDRLVKDTNDELTAFSLQMGLLNTYGDGITGHHTHVFARIAFTSWGID